MIATSDSFDDFDRMVLVDAKVEDELEEVLVVELPSSTSAMLIIWVHAAAVTMDVVCRESKTLYRADISDSLAADNDTKSKSTAERGGDRVFDADDELLLLLLLVVVLLVL